MHTKEGTDIKQIRFRFAPVKAQAALHWLIARAPGIDLHTVLKACYFADRWHLNAHGRPVFGATYRAMKYGPVPLEVYEMAKAEPLWLAELGLERFPWRLEGYRLNLSADADPDLSHLSESDMEAIEQGLAQSRSMTFTERTSATHGSDWQAANLGTMRYEDMLDDSADKADRVAYLREAAAHLRL